MHHISFRFLRVTYFFTLLCWINKTRWRFWNERVQTSPSCRPRYSLCGQAGCSAGQRVPKEHPVPRSLWFCFWVPLSGASATTWNLTALTPSRWQIQLGWWSSQPDGLQAGSGQPSSSAEASARALLVPVSLGQMLVYALSCTSSFPKGLSRVLVKWLSCLSCVFAYEMAILSVINVLQQKPVKVLCQRAGAQSSQWIHVETWSFQTFLRITELYNHRSHNKKRNKVDLHPTS